MPPDSPDRFLIAPVRAVKSSKRHLYLAFCQEPIRRLLGLPRPPRPPKTLGPPGPLGLSGQSGQSGQLGQLGQLG